MNLKRLPTVRNITAATVVFGVVLLCFIWMGMYYKIQGERQLEIDNAFKETANYTRTFEEHTVRTLKGLDLIALSLKYQLEKEGLGIDLFRLVKEERFPGQPFILLGVLNENGDLLANNRAPFLSGINNSDREFFQVQRNADTGKLFVGKPAIGRGSGKMSIQLSRRINKPDGSFGGVVVVSADPNYFAEYYKEINLGEDSSIALVGRDNIVRVRRSGNEVDFGQDFGKSIVMEKVQTNAVGNFIAPSPVDGINRIYSYRAIREYPLVVVAGISEAQAFLNLNRRVVGYYWAGGAMSGTIVIFVILLLGGVARRKRMNEELASANVTLTDANENLHANNDEITVQNIEITAQNQEITAQNEVIESLNENLSGKNEELEQRVTQRTAELAAAYKNLVTRNIELEQSQLALFRNLEMQNILREIAEEMAKTSSLDKLYRTVHRLVGHVFPAENFNISLLDETTGQITTPCCVDETGGIPRKRPPGRYMTEYIIRQKRAIQINEAEFDHLREAGEVDSRFVEFKEWVGAPMIDSQGKVLGVITLLLLSNGQSFRPEEVKFFSIIAAQLSIAIERRQNEEILVENEARYRAVIEQAPEAVLICDPDTGDVIETNSHFTELLGYDLARDGTLNLFELIADEPVNIRAYMSVVSKTGRLPVKRRQFSNKNGTAVSVERSATLVNYLGRSLFVMTLRDVSDEVRREEEMLHDAQMAARVQRALLSLPEPSEYLQIDAVYQPFGYVGGDLYFMDWRYDGTLLRGFLVDATGHGLGTALHTASLHVLLREVNERDLPLSDAMRWLNRRAGEYFEKGTFAGALCFELDLQIRELRWVCGGIPKIWVATKSQQGPVECFGMCLGLSADKLFEVHAMPVDVGDSLYFMTAGLAGLLETQADLPLDRYPEMVALLHPLVESAERQDDATAVFIHVRALPQSLVRQDGWPRIIRFNGYGDHQRLKGEVGKILEEVTGKPHSLHEVAVHEALANAMECRDGVARQQKARIRFNKVGTRFIVRVKTSRIGFAGNAILKRLRSHPEEMFSFGEDAAMGRGIPMMLTMSHKMTYNSEGTEVLLAWKLEG